MYAGSWGSVPTPGRLRCKNVAGGSAPRPLLGLRPRSRSRGGLGTGVPRPRLGQNRTPSYILARNLGPRVPLLARALNNKVPSNLADRPIFTFPLHELIAFHAVPVPFFIQNMDRPLEGGGVAPVPASGHGSGR